MNVPLAIMVTSSQKEGALTPLTHVDQVTLERTVNVLPTAEKDITKVTKNANNVHLTVRSVSTAVFVKFVCLDTVSIKTLVSTDAQKVLILSLSEDSHYVSNVLTIVFPATPAETVKPVEAVINSITVLADRVVTVTPPVLLAPELPITNV